MDLLSQGYITLILIVATGIILGRIKLFGFSLDVSGVLFIALVLGHFGYFVPDDFLELGLLLFIFTIGMQAGPGFFDAFRKHGRQLILISFIIMTTTAIAAFLLNHFLKIDPDLGIGIFTGALTSTPGLAAVIESSQSPLAPIGYGVAYPFGIIGVILIMGLLPRILKIDLKREEEDFIKSVKEDFPDVIGRTFKVDNPNIDGKTVEEIELRKITGCVATRILHKDNAYSPNAASIVYKGDLIRMVGTEKNLKKVVLLFGAPVDVDIPLSKEYDIRWILISNKKIVNKHYREVNLSSFYNARIAKIKRSGVEITPDANSCFKLGDRVLVAGEKNNLDYVSQLLGNDSKKLSETDLLPIFLGILGGILIGKIQIPLFGLFTINLGNTGGALITGLILSKIGKTGPVIWSLSGSANQLIKQLGLLLFLATIGTQAGAELIETIQQYGIKLIWVAVILTILPILTGVVVGRYIYKINFLTLMGIITGTMTSTPGLGIIQAKSSSNAAPVAYASVYPIALVLVIIFSQLLLTLSNYF